MLHRRRAFGFAATLVLVAAATRSPAQCAAEWLADTSLGTNGRVQSLMPWDPDGPGPVAPRLVVAGQFTVAGDVAANQIASYDPATRQWSPLGTGLPLFTASSAMTTLANGNLVVAAGRFLVVWDGTSWSTLATSGRTFNALTRLPNGDLVVGGDFSSIQGVPAQKIARWNGSTWAPLGSGLDTQVMCLEVLPNGDLIAGGYFSTAGGNPANRVARWNGTTWSALGTGLGPPGTFLNEIVMDFAVQPNGDLVAVGRFASAGATPVSNVARWNGSSWVALGTGTNGDVATVHTLPDGQVLVGGFFTTAGGAPAARVARWTGSSWSGLEAGVDDSVSAIASMPDGEVYFGGAFGMANGRAAAHLARYSSAWSTFPVGLAAPWVRAIVTLANGDVVVGGELVPGGVARSDGIAWHPLGGGVSHFFAFVVNDLLELPGGDVVVVGRFNNAGGATMHNIASWNGTAWASFGSGTNGEIRALARLPNGDLVVGGTFTAAGGVPASRIARWDGATWWPLGAGVNGNVNALAVAPNGTLVAGGSFTAAGGTPADRVARWDGATWTPVGGGIGGSSVNVTALLHLDDGSLLAGGQFRISTGAPFDGIARFTSAWQSLGSGVNGSVYDLEQLASGAVVVAGDFTTAGGSPAENLAYYQAGAWSGVVPGTDAEILCLAKAPGGDSVVLGGTFQVAGGEPATAVARWHGGGGGWLAVETGLGSIEAPVSALTMRANGQIVAAMDPGPAGVLGARLTAWTGRAWSDPHTGSDGAILDLLELPGGDLVAGGGFTSIGVTSALGIARWDGQTWHPLGTGLRGFFGVRGFCHCLAVLPNGDLIAGGNFTSAGGLSSSNVARWDGQSWHAMDIGSLTSTVEDLAVMANGDLVAAGNFTTAGAVANGVARWTGAAWSPLGSGMFFPVGMSVNALAAMPDGSLVAAGQFTSAGGVAANHIARWNGTSWSALGAGLGSAVTALGLLPNGDVVASGSFATAGGIAAAGVARWNGASWSAIDNQIQPGSVRHMVFGPQGALFAGSFATTGSRGSYVHQLGSTCAATVTSYGVGCVGSGGLNQLTAMSQPWLGSSFRSRATGMPPLALVFSIYGFAQVSLPIQFFLPQGLPGCFFWSDAALYTLAVSTSSTLDSSVHLPVGVSMPGQVFHHFVSPWELDANSNIAAVSSTNALRATIGTF
jgi:hypothetical protein